MIRGVLKGPMSRSTARKYATALPSDVEADAASPKPARAPQVVPLPGLCALRIEAFNEQDRTASLRVGRDVVEARLDEAVEIAVVKTALARGERVIAQREADGWILIGALRTAATPGVDEGEEYQIKAKRISVH